MFAMFGVIFKTIETAFLALLHLATAAEEAAASYEDEARSNRAKRQAELGNELKAIGKASAK